MKYKWQRREKKLRARGRFKSDNRTSVRKMFQRSIEKSKEVREKNAST